LGSAYWTAKSAAQYGYNIDTDQGVLVARIEPNGPAYKADIREEAIILQVNGTEVNSAADLRAVWII
jgi:S1-C subfamily serine protease